MTPDETKRQKADLLFDFQETQQKLEQLRTKASVMGARLAEFAYWMQTCPETGVFRHADAHCGFYPAPTPNEYIQALSPNEHFDVAQQIRETREKLEQLGHQKDRQGLK